MKINFIFVVDSNNYGVVNGNILIGGITGNNLGDINDSYNYGNVSGVDKIGGLIHCSGGAQTKILHFIDDLHVIKDNLFNTPPLFAATFNDIYIFPALSLTGP